MKGFLKLFIGLCLIFILIGCIGEDYDVGVPTAHIYFEGLSSDFQLAEANISWKTASEEVKKTEKDIIKYASSLDEIKVFPGQKMSLDFRENPKNGGDIWTDPKITVALLKDGKRTELALDDFREFQFPTDKGNYVLEVEFMSSAGNAQYLGNILIQ
ncbi:MULTISPECIES: hypothetical protein [Lysinibacillus]|uniref:hypothetical protein n=1 Tax=Lysinibacillus TaxID=400634 RepID=UPI00083C9619|nr:MULTISPECIES: hypothetical protein [Lysinibacillus]